jgi:hypothetical protein
MEKPKIVSEPTAETKKMAEDWQKKDQKRKDSIMVKQYEKAKIEKAKEMENRKTNQEIADIIEFQEWCKNQGIEPTKRQAGKHREEFENYLSSLEKDAQLKKTA